MNGPDAWQKRFERARAARRAAEELLHTKSRELYESNIALQQRGAELEHALEQLRQNQAALVQRERLATLGGMIGGVAHEVSTPLGVAITAASLQGESLTTLQEWVEERSLTLRRARDLHQDLMAAHELLTINLRRASELMRAFKRSAVDQAGGHPRTTALNTFLHEVVSSLAPLLRSPPIDVSIEAPSTTLHMDVSAFTHILTTLIQNVSVHAFGGASPPFRMQVQAELSAQHLSLWIRDNGLGMPAEVADRVWEPYFTTKRDGEGSGLGVHICKSIVEERLSGNIEVNTAPGEGCAWKIHVPFGPLCKPISKAQP